jgi:hypothetical protein
MARSPGLRLDVVAATPQQYPGAQDIAAGCVERRRRRILGGTTCLKGANVQ